MIQKMLTTSLMVACLATSSLVYSPAMAKDSETYFYPKNKWSIEDVKGKSCIISNQLNNGYNIKVAGTKTGFTNINIDFRQNSFKINDEYKVKYSIPGITEKEITAKAFKSNLLVSDLRKEKEFADALSKASVLDVQIKNTSFRIYLTGFVSKMDEYNNCLTPEGEKVANLDIPQQPKAVEGDLAPLPPLKISSYSKDDSLQDKALQNKPRPDAASSGSYIQELDRQMKEESKKYQKSEIVLKEDGAVKPIKNIISEHFKSEKPTYNVTKLEPMSVDLTRGAQEINPESGDGGNSIHMNNKISELEKQISVLKNENSMLDKELKNTLQDSRDERMSVSSDNWNLERATMKFNESERQVIRLGRQIQTQKSQCQQEKSELENMLFDPTLTDQQQLANLASLEADLDKVNADIYRQQRQYEERIKLLEQQLGAQ